MGLLSNFLSFGKRGDTTGVSDSYSKEVIRCLVHHKLASDEYDMFAALYYQGHTSYRDFFKYVLKNSVSRMNKIADAATEKARDSCNIDFTFLRFYKDNVNYIDIPVDVFTDKKNMPMRQRNTKLWNRENIKRLLVNDPSLRNMDDDLLAEAIKSFTMKKV